MFLMRMPARILPALFLTITVLVIHSPAFAQIQSEITESDNPRLWGGNIPEGLIKKDPSEEVMNNDFRNALRAGKSPDVDTKMKIVNMLIQVKHNQMTPEQFYQEVSKLPTEPGKELRHTLMEVKKDVGNYLGRTGLDWVFGTIFDSGGTFVEAKILTHRYNVVMTTRDEALRIYQQRHGNPKFTFYYGEVGGWPNESFEQLKFAGDIDFNFLSGDLDAAYAVKLIFDELIKARYNGKTPEELDIPCTVLGKATAEVYPHFSGQSFAEKVTKHLKEIVFSEDGKAPFVSDEKTAFEKARRKMLMEVEMSDINNKLEDVRKMNWPDEPGVSLEMIRHFEHDIAGKNVYTDLESFVKAGKYGDRSFKAMGDEAKKGSSEKSALRQLSRKLTQYKANPKMQVFFIEWYYNTIGQPIPFEVHLDINQDGKEKATIEANEALIKGFWESVRQALWENATGKIESVLTELTQRVNNLGENDAEEAKAIHEEMRKYHEMIEVENLLLHDHQAGVHEHMDPRFPEYVKQYRDLVKTFKQKVAKNNLVKYLDPEMSKAYQWVEEMLKTGKDLNVKMAWGAIMMTASKTNDVLDFFDDALLHKLRHGEGDSYIKFLRRGQGEYWKERANMYLNAIGQEGRFDVQFDYAESAYNKKLGDISNWLNNHFEGKLTRRGLQFIRGAGGAGATAIQGINNTFNESVSGSKVGQGMMTGMMVYNLKDELPVYWGKILKEDYEGLAAEFFKRRVPFGGAVERYVMGDYYGVGWEMTSTLVPPAAIVSAAVGVGQSVAMTGIEAHIGEELETFIDNLYDGAEFKIGSIEKVGEDIKVTNWTLLSVSYQGKTFKYDELITMELADAREMGGCLKLPTKERPSCFPMEKMSNGVFEWWHNRDAFEDAFKKTDPWIQLIVEMKTHPNVGPKLEEHFRYQLYTRLEQIKVKFLQELRSKLEDRKAGEQALISGQFLKMYEELFNIAEDLDISVQLQETIDEKFGGGVVQFVTWMKDYLRGVIREVKGDVDVWDVYEELSAFVAKSLKTYKGVREARAKAEAFLGARTEDQGLRMLTGPYFLDGKSSYDQKASIKWEKYPKEAQQTLMQKMQAIKKESDIDPAQLDTTAGSYDAGILEQLTFHETFSELWIHVNSRFLVAKVPSYLGANGAKQTKPNPEGSSDDSDLAVKRFKLHQQRVEDILEEYRKHYENEKKEEDKKGGDEEPGGGQGEEGLAQNGSRDKDDDQESEGLTAGLLAQMKALVEQMTALRAQMTASMEEFKTQTQAIERDITMFDEMYAHISQALKRLIEASKKPASGSPEDILNRLRKDGEDLARVRDQIEQHTLSICEAYETIKANPPLDEADRILQTATTRNRRVSGLHRTASSIVNRMRNTKSQANKMGVSSSNADEMYRLMNEGERLLNKKEKIQQMIRDAGQVVQLIQAAPSQASGIVSQGASIAKQADARQGSEGQQRDLAAIQEIKGMQNTLTNEAGHIEKEPKEIEAIGMNVFFKMGSVKSSAESLRKLLEEARAVAEKEEASGRDWASEIDAQHDAGMLFWDPIAQAQTNAGICMSGVVNQHKVVTSPSGQVAAMDCSNFGNAEAYWDSRNRVARCRCKTGYRPSSSGNRCMREAPKSPAYDPYDDPAYDPPPDRGGRQNEPSFMEEMLERADQLRQENDRRRQEQRQQRRQRQRGPGYDGIFKDEGPTGRSGSSGGLRNPGGGFGSGGDIPTAGSCQQLPPPPSHMRNPTCQCSENNALFGTTTYTSCYWVDK